MERFTLFAFLLIISIITIVRGGSTISPSVLSSKCETGWHQFGSKCFKYHHDQAGANFHDAMAICEYAYHGTMVSIHSEEEGKFISKMVFDDHHAKYSIWIGLHRISNTSLVWVDRSELNFTNWGPNEPDNFQSKHYCAVISSSKSAKGKWFDVGCTATYLVMCQKYLQETFIVSSNDSDSDISIADKINLKSDYSEETLDTVIDKSELKHVKILGNVNIVLTTILFIIIFVFILYNYTFFSFRRNRRVNNLFSFQNGFERKNSIDM